MFILTLLCGASKGFMKAFKAFIEPFETPQRSVKINDKVIFVSLPGIGTGRVNLETLITKANLSYHVNKNCFLFQNFAL